MTRTPLALAASALALALGALAAGEARAHPHVWVTAKAEIAWDDAGRVAGVTHAWTFDRGYSAYVVQGLDVDGDGVYSTEELAELAELNATSLVDFDYFTFVTADGAEQRLGAPTDYAMAFDGEKATLTFTLPLATPAVARTALLVEIYDPTFFVSFRMDDGADAVRLDGGPPGCAIDVKRPSEAALAQVQSLSEAFFEALTALDSLDADMSNRVLVACP